MQNTTQALMYGVIAILVLVLVIRRQMVLRPIGTSRMLVMPAILIVVALASGQDLLDRLHSSTAIVLFVAGLLIGAASGVARAASQRLIWRGGVPYSRGSGWTMALWLATVAIRIGMAALGAVLHAPEASGEVLLFLAVTIGVQNLLLARRAGVPILGPRPQPPAGAMPDPSSVRVEK